MCSGVVGVHGGVVGAGTRFSKHWLDKLVAQSRNNIGEGRQFGYQPSLARTCAVRVLLLASDPSKAIPLNDPVMGGTTGYTHASSIHI